MIAVTQQRRRLPLLIGGLLVYVSAFGLSSCGGNEGSPSDPSVSSFGIQVAGNYSLTRSYLANTCHPEIPGALAPVTGVITQQAGGRFTLRNSDGGGISTAQLKPDASFTNGKQRLVGTDGVPYDYLVEGRFSTTGFRATVTVDLFRNSGTCNSTLDWQATKQGPPNVIPQ